MEIYKFYKFIDCQCIKREAKNPLHCSGFFFVHKIRRIKIPKSKKQKSRRQNLIDEIREKEKQLEKKQEVFQLYKNGLKGLESIENQYIKSDLDDKRRLIGSIFPKKFQFENKKVRTADINPILHKIAHFNRANRKNKKRDKSKKEDLSRYVLKTGLSCAESQNQHFEKSRRHYAAYFLFP